MYEQTTSGQLNPMKEEELQTALDADLQDATSFVDTEIGPHRALATMYYNGEKFGDEEPGRSGVVMPIVRDTARATLPSLMKIFFGPTRVVEFSAGTSTSGDFADDATETVNYVFNRQNPGFQICYSGFKNALVRGFGWLTWYWDDTIEPTYKPFSGVTEEQLQAAQGTLKKHEELRILGKEQVGEQQVPVGQPMLDPQTGAMLPQQMQTVPVFEYEIQIVGMGPCNKVRVAALPPEEVIFVRDAADTECRLIGRRQIKTRGELRSMGYSDDDLEDAGSNADSLHTNPERLVRQGYMITNAAAPSKDQEEFTYTESYYKIDFDGDGISERRKICTVGTKNKILNNEPCNDIPFALLCPDPEPHTLVGLSQADNVMDLQLIQSHVWRDMLDSLKQSIFPRTEYVEGQVNADDVMNTEIGAAIRVRQPGMVRELEKPFVGQQAYPLLDLLDTVREQRTGLSKAALSLDSSALQSTTQIAAAAMVTSSQAQVMLIAQIFAEYGLKPMYMGILKLLVEHQDNQMQFQLNGRTFQVNPATWDPQMQAVVLPIGGTDQKLAVLNATAASQTAVLTTLGQDNPLCSLQEAYNVQVEILRLSGYPDTRKFWRNPQESAQNGVGQTQPAPTPEQVLADAQMKIEAATLRTKTLDMIMKDDLERDKLDADVMLRAYEMHLRYGATVDVQSIKGLIERERNSTKLLVEHARQEAMASAAPAAE